MKRFLSLALVMNFTLASAFAGVKQDVAILGGMAMGYDDHAVKGKTASAIFKNFLTLENGEDELTYKEIKDMEFGDETGAGFTSVKSAKEMGGFAESSISDALESLSGSDDPADKKHLKELKSQAAALATKWSPMIEKLSKQGVKFGYTGFGPGYCGVSFVELIIVDEKDQKVYEVYLSESGEC